MIMDFIRDRLLTSKVRAALVALIIALAGAVTEALIGMVAATGVTP